MNKLLITFYVLVIVFVVAVFLLTQSNFFTKKLCGESTPQQLAVIDVINKEFPDVIIVKAIPCYNEYLEVSLQKDSIPTAMINDINTLITTKYKNLGWDIITVTDHNDNFLFEQKLENGKVKKSYQNSQ